MRRYIPLALVLLALLFSRPPAAEAAPPALPGPPAAGWEPWYAIDFRTGYDDGHWTRVANPTRYTNCRLRNKHTEVSGSIRQHSDGLHFESGGRTAPTIYTNAVLPPEGRDFYVRWKIKWTMKYAGWGMGFYFGTRPYHGRYYEHPTYCPNALGSRVGVFSRIAGMQGDGLSGNEINRWFVVAVEYEAATRTARHYRCDSHGNHCQHIRTQTIPQNEYPVSFHIGHIKKTEWWGSWQEFTVQYLQVYERQPTVTVAVRNPEGTPVPRPLGGAAWESYFGWLNTVSETPWGTHATHSAAPPAPSLPGQNHHGAYVDLAANDVIMWSESNVSAHGSPGYCWLDGNKVYAGWWAPIREPESATLVIATPTPTPTPTPYVRVHVTDPQGTPVTVEELAVGASGAAQTCADCATLERGTGGLGQRLFARIRRFAHQLLGGWSTTADNATLTEGETMDELVVDNWATGREEINFIVVTPTPTPTPQPIPPFEQPLDHTYVYPDDFCTYIVGGVYAAEHALEDVWVHGVITTTRGAVREVAATAARRHIPQGDGSCFKITLCDLQPGEEVADYRLTLDATPAYREYPYVRAYATEIEELGSGYAHAKGRVWVDETSPFPTAENVAVVLWGWDVAGQHVTACDAVGVGRLQQEDAPAAWHGYIRAADRYYYRTTSNPH